MFQNQYFSNYFILCYDSVRDIVFVTTQKCGQTFIGTHLDGVHFEVMDHTNMSRPTYKLGDAILHEFTEAGSSFKELFNCETVEEVLNTKQCYFVIRNPKKRFLQHCPCEPNKLQIQKTHKKHFFGQFIYFKL